MPGTGTRWERIDEPVLRWVAELPPVWERAEVLELPTAEPEQFADIPGVTSVEVANSLAKLRSDGLIAGESKQLARTAAWEDPRVTARGLVVLGEWPDMDLVASAAGVHELLGLVADDAPAEVQSALRRAAGLAGRTADAVVRGTLASVAGEAGGEMVT